MFCERCHRRYEEDHLFCPHDGARLVDSANAKRFRSKPTKMAGMILGDRYEVRGFIGKGAMARVYLAEDLKTGTPVAVKVLETQHVKVARTKARFIQEAKAASMIGHPNIVKVLDVALKQDGTPYLVMEFLYGETLGELLRRDRVLTLKAGLPIVQQISGALAAAHEVDIVHRDVKPDNVFLVGEPGSSYAVKLVDFGFAKLLASQGSVTQAGVAVGTIEYMAPEQVVSDTPDSRTDIYGLGIVMYRMFCGKLPFTAEEDADLLAKHLVIPPPDGALDPQVDIIIKKALKKNPDNRYQTMQELLDDVERVIAGKRVKARYEPSEMDVYVPRTKFAENAAVFLYKRLKMNAPEW